MHGAGADGQLLPHVRHHSAHARVCLRQVLRGRHGHVQANTARARDQVQGVGQVVAGAGAGLHDHRVRGVAGGALHNIGERVGDCLHERREVAVGQKRLAGGDHLQRVTLVPDALAGGEGDVALLGHVIRMPRFGDETGKIVFAPKRGEVCRVGEHVHNVVEHVAILPRSAR